MKANSSHLIIRMNELEIVKLIKLILFINLMFSQTFNDNKTKHIVYKNTFRLN